MKKNFEFIKSILLDLGFIITIENEAEELVVVEKTEVGVINCVVDCEDPIVIIQQPIVKLPQLDLKKEADLYRSLLEKNMELVHGSFAIDENGNIVFRDTLQIENLDKNELEGTMNALSLCLAENTDFFIEISKL